MNLPFDMSLSVEGQGSEKKLVIKLYNKYMHQDMRGEKTEKSILLAQSSILVSELCTETIEVLE